MSIKGLKREWKGEKCSGCLDEGGAGNRFRVGEEEIGERGVKMVD